MMKVKNRSLLLRVLLTALLGVSVPVGIIFRVMQLFYAVDYSTGFYKGWHFSMPALDIVLACCTAFTLLLSFLLRHFPLSSGTRRDRSFSVLPLLCAIGLAGQLVLQLIRLTEISVFALISIVLSVICFILFLLLAFSKKQEQPGSGAMIFRNTVIALWCCSEMLLLFFVHSAESNTSEFVITILFLYFASLFFIRCGKLSFEKEPSDISSFSLLTAGSLMGLFGFVLSVPNIIVAVYSGDAGAVLSPFSCAALPLACYGLIFVFSNCLNTSGRKGLQV